MEILLVAIAIIVFFAYNLIDSKIQSLNNTIRDLNEFYNDRYERLEEMQRFLCDDQEKLIDMTGREKFNNFKSDEK